MSARPDVPRLSEEELDLLISRSLDGDLSPEEEQQLERLVALDPAAAAPEGRARRARRGPEGPAGARDAVRPRDPRELERRRTGGRPGSLGGRIGFFPAPGFAKAALVILGIVGASIAILRPAPKRLAEGPVDVLLYNAPKPASPAPQALIAEAKPARERANGNAKDLAKEKAFAPEADARRKADASEAPEHAAAGDKKAMAKLEGARQNEVAIAADAPVLAEAAPKQRADRDEGGMLDAVRQQAPAKVTSSGTLAAVAPAAPAARPETALAARFSRRGRREPRRRAAGPSRCAATPCAAGLSAGRPTTRRPRAEPPCTASRSTPRAA